MLHWLLQDKFLSRRWKAAANRNSVPVKFWSYINIKSAPSVQGQGGVQLMSTLSYLLNAQVEP